MKRYMLWIPFLMFFVDCSPAWGRCSRSEFNNKEFTGLVSEDVKDYQDVALNMSWMIGMGELYISPVVFKSITRTKKRDSYEDLLVGVHWAVRDAFGEGSDLFILEKNAPDVPITLTWRY